jgi:hypothetical protein
MNSLLFERDQVQRTFTVKEVEKLSTFFGLTFTQNVKSFQYICEEIQPEVIESRLLSVQTPLIPMDTSKATSISAILNEHPVFDGVMEV